MEELIKVETLIDHTKDYLHARVDEAKLALAEKASGVISVVITGSVVSLVFVFCLFFSSISAAIALGNWLHKLWLGFLLVGSVYLLLGLIVWAAKDRLIRIPVMDAIIHQLFKNDTDEED
ncbi:MAG TPA: phage holin family protein [Puia sp.]|jgi:hypothetical protein|nr:phage holin family protein [Puia sp.]